MEPIFLEKGQVRIRPLEKGDAPLLLRWLSDPRVLQWYEGRDVRFTPEKIEETFYSAEPGICRCVVEWEGRPAGYVQVYPLSGEGLKEYGYPHPERRPFGTDQFLGEPDLWGRGIGRAFLSLLLSYLTRELGAKAVVLDPHVDNLRAIRCYEACGFRRKKPLPAHELHEGEWRDCWLMEYRFGETGPVEDREENENLGFGEEMLKMENVDLNLEISRLVRYGEQKGLLSSWDRAYAANRLLAVLGVSQFEERPVREELPYPREPLERICDWAAEKGVLSPDTRDDRDRLDTELMACLTPRPGEVVERFWRLYREDPKKATDDYYALCRASNYIRVDRVEKDKKWTVPTAYGDLVITINLSKPEKDPKAIAAARNAPSSGYPKCALCRENEGFKGSANQAARGNHRLIPLTLSGEPWYLQYSPYVYYNEHCIVLSGEHRPMKVSRASLERLLEFVTVLPHYFVGSNADLPIVGGSILSHDHFQGGNFQFPMAKAPVENSMSFCGFSNVQAGIVKWPMSVLRLRSGNREDLVELGDRILQKWREYSDESVGVLAYTGDTPHNTITPIARRRGEDYELDLVLRNNRTTPEHPLGLFHPHGEYHHIKKENIGLIEVMGLAILPPRLLGEMEGVAEALAHPEREKDVFSAPGMEQHLAWYRELREAGVSHMEGVRDSVGHVFERILGNAGVFKDTPEGREAFRRFCRTL